MRNSENLGNLALALCKVQSEITDVCKDKKGYGYMFADLSSVLDIARPLLSKNDLSVSQLCVNDGDKIGVETILMHKSGEWISSQFTIPVERMISSKTGKETMSLAQASGSVITYARRYALAAIIGIAQTDNDASISKEENGYKPVQYQQKPTVVNNMNELKILFSNLEPHVQKDLLEKLKIVKIEDLNSTRVVGAIEWIKVNYGENLGSKSM